MKYRWNRSRNLILIVLAAFWLAACDQPARATGPSIMVYKSPTCGCCKKWVSHLQANGFNVQTTDMTDVVPIKIKYGVKPKHASCHTAVVNGYVIEGHVPADVIKKLLKEKPGIAGLAVPGMPIGSPGMEVEGKPAEKYDILAFKKNGDSSVYARR